MSAATVGAVLAGRRPRHPVGWLLLAMPLAPRPPEERYQVVDNPLDLRPFDGALLLANQAALAVTVLGILVGAGSLVVRFRRAHGVERLQLRWVVLAAA